MNGWACRLRGLWEVINQPGGLAVVILAIGLALYTGYLPSPVTRTELKLDQHIATVSQIVQQREEEQRRLIEALSRLSTALERRDYRDRIRECAEIRDPEIRRACWQGKEIP